MHIIFKAWGEIKFWNSAKSKSWGDQIYPHGSGEIKWSPFVDVQSERRIFGNYGIIGGPELIVANSPFAIYALPLRLLLFVWGCHDPVTSE